MNTPTDHVAALWLIAALVLAALEMLTPGYFLIMIAAGALLATGAAALFPDAFGIQFLTFVAGAAVATYLGHEHYRAASRDGAMGLNAPIDSMIGKAATVTEPIRNGRGRISVSDSTWPATGPDMDVGANVLIVAAEGLTLVVRPAHAGLRSPDDAPTR